MYRIASPSTYKPYRTVSDHMRLLDAQVGISLGRG